MTQPRDGRLFGLATAIAVAVLALGWTAALQPAAAAGSHCDISGTVEGNQPARVGDALETRAFIGGATCKARAMQFDGGGRSWGYQALRLPQQTEYDAVINAFPGLSSISVVLSDGQQAVIYTATVVSDQTPPPVRTTAPLPPPPPSIAPPATPTVRTAISSAAQPSTTKAKTTAASSARASRAPVVVLPSFGGGSGGESTGGTSAASTSPHSAGADVAFKVAVIHGDGSVHAIPGALLIATIVVLGAILGAAVRFVHVNSRGADHIP